MTGGGKSDFQSIGIYTHTHQNPLGYISADLGNVTLCKQKEETKISASNLNKPRQTFSLSTVISSLKSFRYQMHIEAHRFLK